MTNGSDSSKSANESESDGDSSLGSWRSSSPSNSSDSLSPDSGTSIDGNSSSSDSHSSSPSHASAVPRRHSGNAKKSSDSHHQNPFTTTSAKLSAIANKSCSPKRAMTSPTTSTDSHTSSSASSIILGLGAKTSPSKHSHSTSPNATERHTPSSKALSINTPALPSLENYPLSQKFPSSNSEKDNLSLGKCPFHTKNTPHFLTPCEAKPMSHHRHPRNIDQGASRRRAAIWRGIGECTTSTRLSRDHG